MPSGSAAQPKRPMPSMVSCASSTVAHVIRLENVFPVFRGKDPSCIEGRRRGPVEGVGGIRVWNEVAAVLTGKVPITAVDTDLLLWVGGSVDPLQFNWRATNRHIRQWIAHGPPPPEIRPPRPVVLPRPPVKAATGLPRPREPYYRGMVDPGLKMVEFHCVLDAAVAGRVGIARDGTQRSLVVDSPWGRVTHLEYPWQPVADGLTLRDAGFLHFLHPEFAPFWCPQCEAVYCGAHWTSWDVDDEGFPDQTRGVCPRGHERKLLD